MHKKQRPIKKLEQNITRMMKLSDEMIDLLKDLRSEKHGS